MLYGMGGHLGFICTCTKVAGIGARSSGGREAKKNRGTVLTSWQLTLMKHLVHLAMQAFDWLLDNGL